MKLKANPASTSRTGYGMSICWATTTSAATKPNNSTIVSACCIVDRQIALRCRGTVLCRLCPGTRSICFQFCQVFFGPATKGVQRLDQCSTKAGQRVLDLRWHDWMYRALHESVTLKAAKCLGQHL